MNLITIEDSLEEENLGQCECGNYAHHYYLSHDDDGNASCPTCQIAYMDSLLKNMIALVKEIADPSLSKADVKSMIVQKYCLSMGIAVEDVDEANDFGINLN